MTYYEDFDMRKLLVIFSIIFSFCVLAEKSVSAAEYADILRVGIYYGSGAVGELSAESADGFAAGVYNDRTFVPLARLAAKNIKVCRDTAESAGGDAAEAAWHIRYAECAAADEAQQKAAELAENGINAFAVYSSGKIYVWGELFKNSNDAVWAAENLAVSGIAIKTSEKAVKIVDADTGKILLACDDETAGIGIANSDFDNTDKTIKISGAAGGSYRGGFELKRLTRDALTVVNVVPTEKYLYGVVSREMSPSWNREALKAQAVCARNFALRRINYHKDYGFDVCRTVCCQAYSGLSEENDNVRAAVDETHGELLFCGDELVQALYCSSAGARTESVENVWGTPFSYLVSVDNNYEDTDNIYNGKWTKTLTSARATEIMKSRGYDIGTVTDITPIAYTDAGRVLQLKVSGTNGEKIFERDACRNIFSEAVYSQKYTVSKGGGTVYPTVSVTDGIASGTKTINSVSVIDGSRSISTVSGACTATDGAANKYFAAESQGGSADEFVFSGEGWGHGVGMSQYGAKGMADAGFSYIDILTHFYTGTEVRKAY